MRKLLLCTLACLLYGCNFKTPNRDDYHSVNDIESREIFLLEVDTVHDFQRSGDFVVVGDTVYLCDYYFNYNDEKELSLFVFNRKAQNRVVEYKDKGPLELSVTDGTLNIFRRGWDAVFEVYDMQDLRQEKDAAKKEVHFKSVDHLVKADSLFIACAIIEGKDILNIYNKDGDWKKCFDPFEGKLNTIASANERYIIGQGCLSYNAKHRFLVYATAYTGDIFVYDVDGSNLVLKRHIRMGKGMPDDVQDFKVKSSTWVYANDICSDGDYVYVLFQDDKFTANPKGCNILRIGHDGDVVCFKGYISINKIKVVDGFLYGIGKRNGEKRTHLYKAKLY